MIKLITISKINLKCVVVVIIVLLLSLDLSLSQTNSTDLKLKTISSANNYFAFNLLKELVSKDNNVLISPLSLSTSFNMLYFGAKERTAQEIEDVFGLGLLNLSKPQIGVQYKQLMNELIAINNSSAFQLLSANYLVAQNRNPLLNEYTQELKEYFNSSIQKMDFLFKSEEAVQQINHLVGESTRGKIVKLLDQSLSPLSVLIVINGIYFKGQWRQRFLKWATKEEDFHSLNKVIKVPQMKLSNTFNYTTITQLNESQLIELPYSDDSHLSMYVLLPTKSSPIQEVCAQLTAHLFDDAVANMTLNTVRLILPRFNLSMDYELKSTLQTLGMNQIFTYKSDLSAIDGTNYLHISEVYHKMIIEVDEEGSQVVNTNGPMAQTRGLFGRYRNVPTFKADHPFLFFIKHKPSGVILFAGVLNKP